MKRVWLVALAVAVLAAPASADGETVTFASGSEKATGFLVTPAGKVIEEKNPRMKDFAFKADRMRRVMEHLHLHRFLLEKAGGIVTPRAEEVLSGPLKSPDLCSRQDPRHIEHRAQRLCFR